MSSVYSCLILLTFIVASFCISIEIGNLQSVSVNGTLLCNDKPAKNIKVKLYEEEASELSHPRLDYKKIYEYLYVQFLTSCSTNDSPKTMELLKWRDRSPKSPQLIQNWTFITSVTMMEWEFVIVAKVFIHLVFRYAFVKFQFLFQQSISPMEKNLLAHSMLESSIWHPNSADNQLIASIEDCFPWYSYQKPRDLIKRHYHFSIRFQFFVK